MADSDLTTLAAAADVLGVSASDPKLPRLIGAASGAIRRYLNRPQLHYGAAIVEKLPGFKGQVRLYLGVAPLISVASVVMPDGSTLDPADYTVEDLDAAALYRAAGWPYTGLCDDGGRLYGEVKAIVVTYAGGWVTPAQSGTRNLPFEIEEACLLTVVSMYRSEPRDPSIASESLGDYSVAYQLPNSIIGVGQSFIPHAAQSLLSTYRRLQ
ncbi:MAG: hypothetical protein JNJ54_35065 [Myxococcaceae bacterium]|nr:hypothetical protein [Myxococcaceae bacterium]